MSQAEAVLDFGPAKLPTMQLVPPRDAEPVGFVESGDFKGRVIYEQETLDVAATKASKVIKTDPITGEEVWAKHPTTGEKQYPKFKTTPVFRRRRFILVANDIARTVKMIENFEMSAEERAELAERNKRETFLSELINGAVARGMTADELLTEVTGKAAAALELPEDAVEIDDETAGAIAEAMGDGGVMDHEGADEVTVSGDAPKRRAPRKRAPRKKKSD